MLLFVALFAAGCTTAEETDVHPVSAPSLPFVVIGAGQSDGGGIDDDLRNLWARRLLQELPRRTVYVNLARSGATVASALADQGPDAAALEPTLVTIWLLSADAVVETPLADFRRDLTALASSFDTETDVVLLTTWSDGNTTAEAPYVDEIRAVAAATAASIVDVTDLGADDPDAQQQVADRVLAAARSG
jgi:hypothetical protein